MLKRFVGAVRRQIEVVACRTLDLYPAEAVRRSRACVEEYHAREVAGLKEQLDVATESRVDESVGHIPCPLPENECGALTGDRCRRGKGGPLCRRTHKQRVTAWREEKNPKPEMTGGGAA